MSDATAKPNTHLPEEPIRVALLVEYCGSAFCGSQFQPELPTVQRTLEEALAQLGLATSAVSFASRTDTGVHAKGQVAHFDIAPNALVNVPHLVKALNAVLPATVSVQDARIDTGLAFNSRREALAKWYRYIIYNHETRSVWAGADAAHVQRPLDAARMDAAARLLEGTHDFASFKCPDTDVTDNVCTVYHSRVHRDGERVIFDIVANRFLYKMVRNLTGQLIAIGKAGHTPENILEVLAQRNRQAAAPTAKPEGLSLMAIRYGEPHGFFHANPNVQTLITLMESKHNENLFRKAS